MDFLTKSNAEGTLDEFRSAYSDLFFLETIYQLESSLIVRAISVWLKACSARLV